ncbi:MAG: hypothetical protein U1E56_13705 [Bauldia sp.]
MTKTLNISAKIAGYAALIAAGLTLLGTVGSLAEATIRHILGF